MTRADRRTDPSFWNKVAAKYARSKIGDMDSYEYTLERTASYLNKGDRVVELGAGTGTTALRLAGNVAQYRGTDYSSEMIAIAKSKAQDTAIPGLEFETADAVAALQDAQHLDAVLSFNLLHLVRDMPAVLNTAHSVLRSGGLLITKTVCLRDASFKYQLILKAIPLMQILGKAPFVRKMHIAEYDAMIEAAGFEIVETGNHPANPPSRYVVARKLP